MAIKIAGVDVINDDRELVLAKLTDINETINDTSVDVFIYDTSKDSDGGAWRHRTQHTSWYAEASSASRDPNTRSTRAEFPAVAVIVAEADKVTIYDGDDPSLPMWMVFEVSSNQDMLSGGSNGVVGSLASLNGTLIVGQPVPADTSRGGLKIINFAHDRAENLTDKSGGTVVNGYYKGAISERNDGLDYANENGISRLIVDIAINDVAMTVLPGAPTDPATGLPVPTIAVATDGGVSVIKDDGTVVDSVSTLVANSVQTTSYGVWWVGNINGVVNFATWDDVIAGDGFGDLVAFTGALQEFSLLASGNPSFAATDSAIYFAGNNTSGTAKKGLMTLLPDNSDLSNSLTSFTTASTPPIIQPSGTKMAALADTDTTALSGTALNNTTNYTTEWTALQSDWTINTTELVCDGASGSVALAAINFATAGIDKDVGDQVGIRFTVSPYTSGQLDVSFSNGAATETAITGTGTYEFTNTLSANAVLYLRSASGTGAFVGTVNNVEIFDVDPDRSVNGRGLGVHGSITKAAVATGADVVAYSGFSSSNYLEQPYNDDLDFGAYTGTAGTGDFCVMGWLKDDPTTTATDYVVSRRDVARVGAGLEMYIDASHKLSLFIGGTPLTSTASVRTNSWVHVCAYRQSGTIYLYIDGVSQGSASNANNLTNTSAPLFMGGASNNTSHFNTGSLALWRISATAPTADQIAKIYEDERPLFQPNAKATLTGNSDAVTALAHDLDTNLLHVGTSGGRSVFQGLRRVEEHTDTDNQSLAAISAVDGLVVEGK